MTLPNATFVINPKFAAPRSYWRSICVNLNPNVPITFVDGTFHIVEFGNLGRVDTYIILDPRFFPWSSNNWTLDFLFLDQYSIINFNPTHVHFHCNVGIGYNATNYHFCAIIGYDVGSVPNFFSLPPAPPDYWLPPLP